MADVVRRLLWIGGHAVVAPDRTTCWTSGRSMSEKAPEMRACDATMVRSTRRRVEGASRMHRWRGADEYQAAVSATVKGRHTTMHRARRSSPVVVMLPFASVGTAYAECAWVLWEHTRRASDKREWRVLRAVSSRRECEADGRARTATLLTRSGVAWYWSRAVCTDELVDRRRTTGKDGLMPPARRAGPRLKPLPMRTPISDLGLTPAEARKLTPAARKLTRGDLMAMIAGQVPRAAQALTLRDLTSISQVYSTAMKAGLGVRPGPNPGCCCCCGRVGCCCCCAVEVGARA